MSYIGVSKPLKYTKLMQLLQISAFPLEVRKEIHLSTFEEIVINLCNYFQAANNFLKKKDLEDAFEYYHKFMELFDILNYKLSYDGFLQVVKKTPNYKEILGTLYTDLAETFINVSILMRQLLDKYDGAKPVMGFFIIGQNAIKKVSNTPPNIIEVKDILSWIEQDHKILMIDCRQKRDEFIFHTSYDQLMVATIPDLSLLNNDHGGNNFIRFHMSSPIMNDIKHYLLNTYDDIVIFGNQNDTYSQRFQDLMPLVDYVYEQLLNNIRYFKLKRNPVYLQNGFEGWKKALPKNCIPKSKYFELFDDGSRDSVLFGMSRLFIENQNLSVNLKQFDFKEKEEDTEIEVLCIPDPQLKLITDVSNINQTLSPPESDFLGIYFRKTKISALTEANDQASKRTFTESTGIKKTKGQKKKDKKKDKKKELKSEKLKENEQKFLKNNQDEFATQKSSHQTNNEVIEKEKPDSTSQHNITKNKNQQIETETNNGEHEAALESKKPFENLHKAIHIEEKIIPEGGKGFGYKEIFLKFNNCIDEDLKHVKIEDTYIVNQNQVYNLQILCELLVNNAPNLKKIDLITMPHKNYLKQQNEEYENLRLDLEDQGIQFNVEFNRKLHDRSLSFNNGWKIKIGRGLDIYRKVCYDSPKYINLDMKFWPCKATSIDYYKIKKWE